MLRIAIIGGYGVFGGRLARVLSRMPEIELVIAGRRCEEAEAFAKTLMGPAKVEAAAVDIDLTLQDTLAALQPDLVVHCAGPFQKQDYRVARAAISVGAHYADLADGRTFVAGFNALDAQARAAGKAAFAGLSTTPALSTTAALSLAEKFASVRSVSVGVTPGNRAPRGQAVTEAILSYVGEKIPTRRNGRRVHVTAWGDLRRVHIEGLGARWLSTCDTPDLDAMAAHFPSAPDISFRAGLELSALHVPLWVLAQVRRARLLPNLAGAAPFLVGAAQLLEWAGTDRGGMYVELVGLGADGEALRACWTLVAEAGDGPFIPVLGVAALVKRLARGVIPESGARSAAGLIALDEYEAEFSAFAIKTNTEFEHGKNALQARSGR